MAKINTLSLTNLQTDSNKFFKKVEKTIQSKSGKEYKVVFKENMKETDVAEFFTKMVERVDYCNKNGVDFNILSVYMLGVFECFIEIPKINKKTMEETISAEIRFLDLIIDLGLYSKIIEEIGEDRMKEFSDIILRSQNKEMLDLLSDKQISNLILNNKLEISDGENI